MIKVGDLVKHKRASKSMEGPFERRGLVLNIRKQKNLGWLHTCPVALVYWFGTKRRDTNHVDFLVRES